MTSEPQTGRWDAIGGRAGGTVSALAFSPTYGEDQRVYAATLAGVFRSSDGGLTWQSSSFGLPNPFVDALVVSPEFAQDQTVFAGGRAAGVSRSTDGGDIWEPLYFWSNVPPSIAALAISPLFGGDQTLFAGAEDGVVYRSTNRGRTWDAVGAGLSGAPVLALAAARGMMSAGTLFAGTAAGLFRSDDQGASWASAGLGDSVVQAIALSSHFDLDNILFVGTETDGVLRSSDGGETWRAVNDGLTDLCINGLAASPGLMIDGILLAATASGVFRTEDLGDRWTLVGDIGSALTIAIPPPPTRPDYDIALHRTALAGTAQQGLFLGSDAGLTWRASNQGLAARLLVTLAISPDFAQDQALFTCGLEEGIHRSLDGGVTWTAINDGLPALEVAGLALSPAFAADRVMVAATSGGVAISRDGGDHWLDTGGPVPTQAVALAPTFQGLGGLLAAGTDGSLHLSPDAGLTWRVVTTPFGGEEVAMVAFSPSYDRDQTLFVATSRPAGAGSEGRSTVWLSADAGQTWEAVMLERDQTRWLSLAVPPTFGEDRAFYIGLADRVLRPMRRATESRFGGRRPIWIGERPGGARTTVVNLALSPAYAEDGTLFAATSTGVYVSRNAGLSWRALDEGLSDRSIVAVVVSPAYQADGLVFAASLGGTIWRWRDARPSG